MVKCHECKKPIESTATHTGYVHPHADRIREQEALDANDPTLMDHGDKQYAVCLDCYRALWKKQYPKVECPV